MDLTNNFEWVKGEFKIENKLFYILSRPKVFLSPVFLISRQTVLLRQKIQG